eukprot:GILI01022687.1.p2 GENE.GILI01022687.1~~GILI01022687.1.p2  ORF type:complete len:198 (-),score=47.35 GILI01022687.1:37-543(-)
MRLAHLQADVQGDSAAAIDLLRQVLSEDKESQISLDFCSAAAQLSSLLLGCGQLQEALKWARRALEMAISLNSETQVWEVLMQMDEGIIRQVVCKQLETCQFDPANLVAILSVCHLSSVSEVVELLEPLVASSSSSTSSNILPSFTSSPSHDTLSRVSARLSTVASEN